MSVTLQTERLEIRPIREEDWRSVQAIWRDFQKSEYVFFDNEKDTSDDAMKNRIAKWASAAEEGRDHLFFAVCREGETVGFAALNRAGDGYELSYGFRTGAQGQGFALESLSAILDEMKRRGVKRVFAGTALRNTPSVRLLQKLHFVQTGTEERAFFKDRDGKDIRFTGGIFERIL